MEIRRPLKRAMPKLGPPDIYPQDPKQKEDELTSVNVKQGYTSAPLVTGPQTFDEFGSAKNANIDAFGVYFSALLSEKHRINTLKDTQKKKQLVNTKEIWYVHAKTKHAVDNWFRDLANGTKSLGQLGKRIPIFNSKEGMFAQLYESHVPLAKAVWFIKMSAVHAIALSESSAKSKKRQVPDQYQELTAALTKYLKEISIRMSECYQQSQHHLPQLQQQQQQQLLPQHQQQFLPQQQQTPQQQQQPSFYSLDFIPTYNQWQYQTQLARYLFDEGLLDQYDFLCFLLELIEKKRPINDLVVKVICPLILEYVTDFSRSAVLSRRLAHVCAKRLCSALHHHPISTRSTRKNELAQHQLNNHQTRSQLNQHQHQQHQNLITTSILDIVKAQVIDSLIIDQENSENNLYKNAIYILSSILQVICIECPTSMVRHHIVDAKFLPMYQGSPLDHLPCLPSNLPMMESDLNFELRRSIHDAEREILHRSAMADSKWSCDSSSRFENSMGGLVNRLLTVLDILDKHNFDKIDSINSVDILYPRIFPSSTDASPSVKTANPQPTQTTSFETPSNLSANSGILDLSSTSSTFTQPTNIESHNKKNKHPHQSNPQPSVTNNQENVNEQTSSTQNSYEEPVIKLLCEWATTTQRTGEHRALVVARLLEKRQSELTNSILDELKTHSSINSKSMKIEDLKLQSNPVTPTNEEPKRCETNVAENNSNQLEEIVHYTFQDMLVHFLDENAPIVDDNQEESNLDNKKAFNNLVLLFSELIRCDVFSHYNYMCTLISRGMFNDLSKSSTVTNAESSNIDSPAPNSNLNQPGSVKQSKSSLGKDSSDSILSNTIQGLSSNSNIYPLTVSTNTSNQSNHLDPLSSNRLGSSADQSLRSLGFSPVSSQQNVSQNLDKGHGLLHNHDDDVDADLGKILQDIKEGQQDEVADILLPDYLSGSREENTSKNPQINKLSPFGLSERSTLDNPPQSVGNVMNSNNFQPSSVESKPILLNPVTGAEKTAKNPSETRHMTFVKNFPVPDDDNFIQDMNQRNILLYGFGKDRDDARYPLKKIMKDINKLLHRKAARDINDGGKIKRMPRGDGFNPETTLHRFGMMNHHDQHMITNSLSIIILEMFTGVSNGQTSLLPVLESVSFVFDLFTIASNVSGLLELVIPILEELPDIEAQIRLKCPVLANQYTHSIALSVIGVLYRFQSCLLLCSKDELCSIFESLYKLVSHVPNPAICTTSAERVIFYYLYDLYSAQTGKIFDQFSGLVQRIKQALQNVPMPMQNNIEHEWQQTFLPTVVNHLRTLQPTSNSTTNPILSASSGLSMNNMGQLNTDITVSIRQQFYQLDSPSIRQMNEQSSARYRFVCDAIFLSATSTNPDLVNDIAVLCADVTSKCPALINDWIFVLQALCCPAQRELGYRQLVNKINIVDPQVMDNIAIFTAILVARRCLQLDDFIIKCAIGAVLAPLSVDKQSTEPSVRLTCHLLLSLFRDRESLPNQPKTNQPSMINTHNAFGQTFSGYGNCTPNYSTGLLGSVSHMGLLQTLNKDSDNISKPSLSLKYLCDHHLLRSACCSIKTECHITLLKAIRVLAMWASPANDVGEVQGKIKTETHFDDMSMDGINVTKDMDIDGSANSMNPDYTFNLKHINLQKASLHEFADAILRLLCSQKWLHGKCLSDSEIFTTIDTEKNILLDPRIDVKQSQRLLYMICYNKSPEKQADVGLDDQGSDQVASIVKMFENLDVWSMRLSLMRLQFMFAYCRSQSSGMLNDWLDNLAKAVVEFFQKASQENDNSTEKESEEVSDPKVKNSFLTNNSIANINKVWLIEPLLDKLTKPPSAIQGKIIKASAALMESASVRANSLPSLNQTYLSTAAASTKFKERTLSQRGSASTNPSNLASTSLLGFQPFLSLLLSCLKNQDKERETLLTSLNSQLYQAIHEKVDDIGYKQSLQDGLELRLCLIGQMFDTIQRSAGLTSDWATLLLLLIMNNLVDPQVDYGLYVSVLDMLAMLIHSAYASDPIEQKEEAKKQYQNLVKKFRKELGALEEKGFIQMKLINPLMPLVRQMTEVITCEPMGSLVDTKGEKVENFYSIDKKKGLKVAELQEVSPWDLIEGHKNPAPLSWPWFGAVRMEQKPLRADENNRLMSWHTHTMRYETRYFCEVPNNLDGPSSPKRSNSEKKPSQTNPLLLKQLIEANKKENDSTHNTSIDDDAMCLNSIEDQYIGREDLLEDYCELPVDLLFDSAPIETMIENIKTAMQAEDAAIAARAKPQIVDTKSILNPSPQASSILAPVQPESSKRSVTPQVSALSALQNHLNTSGSVEPVPIQVNNSGPNSVPPPPMVMSPIVTPHTPEIIPPRPPSNIPKITPTPPPSVSVINRSLSPMVVVRSPAVLAPTPTPPPPAPKAKAPRKKRMTKKEALANAMIDANANIPAMNKNSAQINMMPPAGGTYVNSMDTMNHSVPVPVPPPPQLIVGQPKHGPSPQQNQMPPMHQISQQQQQQQQTQGMIVRRGPISQAQQHQQIQQQQQASVYDFQYSAQPNPPQSSQFVNSSTMNTYYDTQGAGNGIFNQQQQQPQPQMQMSMQNQQHQHHPQQAQHQMQTQQQHIPHQHHQIQYQQPAQLQHNSHQHMAPQPIRLAGHQHQQSLSFQQIQHQQHPQQQIFAPQQVAGHSRPALTAMLHQKHAAAGNMDNKMHPQQRFNFG